MPETDRMPDLKEVVGALIFAAHRSVSAGELRKCLLDTAEQNGGETNAFKEVTPSNIKTSIAELNADLEKNRCGFTIGEVAGGYRLESSLCCGKWVRVLLDRGKTEKLSRPALETMAIIAYRQPITKAEIEGIRGVDITHILKSLMEMQLVRIVDRSDLPGKPFLYGTTRLFLDHFGLKNLQELNDMEPMLAIRREAEAGVKPQEALPDSADPKCDVFDEDDIGELEEMDDDES